MTEPIRFSSPYDIPDREVGEELRQAIVEAPSEVDRGPISFVPPPMTRPEGYQEPSSEPPEAARVDPGEVLGQTTMTHLIGGRQPQDWSWEQLRDYVVDQIVSHHGNFPRNPLRESGIFKGFLARHGDRAGEIAIYAFEGCKGWWKNSPIGVERFTKGSDPWFAEEIVSILDMRLAPAG
jgi:hypothetical protein